MKNQNIHHSLLALVLAASATTGATTNNNISNVLATGNKNEAELKKEINLKSATKARYKDEKHSLVEGSIFLTLKRSNVTPVNSNQLHAEYEGNLYFESTEKFDGYSVYVPMGGEDGNILLDLINMPKKDSDQPARYNMHGCNSTTTSCEPLAIQVLMYKNGTIALDAKFDSGIEILDNNEWSASGYDLVFTKVKFTK